MILEEKTLIKILNDKYNLKTKGKITLVGKGLDFIIYKIYSDHYKINLAIRLPIQKNIIYGSESYNTTHLLEKEFDIYNFLYKNNIIVPFCFFIHSDNINSFMVYEYIENDNSQLQTKDLAEHLSLLHSLPCHSLDNLNLSDNDKDKDFHDYLISRIIERLNVLNSHTKNPNLLLNDSVLDKLNNIEIINEKQKDSLLHLDLRKENILTHKNSIVSFIDWTYAMTGNPLMEIYRLDEYNLANNYHLDMSDLKKHYSYIDFEIGMPQKIENIIFRLDAAIMIAIVFINEGLNSTLLKKQLDRTLYLVEQLKKFLHKNF